MSSTFHDHYNYTDEYRRPLLSRIRREIRELDDGLIEKVTGAQRIAYSKRERKVFLEVKVQRRAIVLHMINVPDPNKVLAKVPESHEWRQLTGRVKIETAPELERILPLIRAAYLRG